jgi:hypothetical protein
MIGQTLHYEILGPLGEAGWRGHKAQDPRLGRLVAMVLPSEANTNPDGKRRFVREAKQRQH